MPFKIQPMFYSQWQGMKSRCYNPNNKHFKNYGGRGIKVCDRWMQDYQAFETDMGPRPAGFTLDRIDNDGDYTPNNCRWADRRTQQRNLRKTKFVEIDGKRYKAVELADVAGVKMEAIVSRVSRGMSYEDVVRQGRYHPKITPLAAISARKAKSAARTHCRNGHLLTPENTYITKDNSKVCRICHNAKVRRLNAKKRERALIEKQLSSV